MKIENKKVLWLTYDTNAIRHLRVEFPSENVTLLNLFVYVFFTQKKTADKLQIEFLCRSHFLLLFLNNKSKGRAFGLKGCTKLLITYDFLLNLFTVLYIPSPISNETFISYHFQISICRNWTQNWELNCKSPLQNFNYSPDTFHVYIPKISIS